MMRPELLDLDGLVFLRRDVLAQGYSDSQIAALVKSGVWHRIRRGAYVLGEVWRSLSAGDRHRLLCRAVLRTAHPSAVLSHVSAAVEWGAPIWGVSLDIVHITRVDGKGGRREAGVVQHRGLLPTSHQSLVNGVPLTAPARCAVEMMTLTTVEKALVTVNGLLHAQLMSPAELAELSHDLRYWPDSITSNLVTRLADPRPESPGESRTSYFMWAHHLPKPIPQFEIRDEHGRLVARVDFALPEHGIFIEFDGAEKYQRYRRPGESLEAFIMREKRREELVCQLTGWVCVRITWADLEHPHSLAERIRALLNRPARHSWVEA